MKSIDTRTKPVTTIPRRTPQWLWSVISLTSKLRNYRSTVFAWQQICLYLSKYELSSCAHYLHVQGKVIKVYRKCHDLSNRSQKLRCLLHTTTGNCGTEHWMVVCRDDTTLQHVLRQKISYDWSISTANTTGVQYECTTLTNPREIERIPMSNLNQIIMSSNPCEGIHI